MMNSNPTNPFLKTIFLTLILLLSLVGSSCKLNEAQEEKYFPLHGDLAIGPNKTGFKEMLFDSVKAYVWYPATSEEDERQLTFQEYVLIEEEGDTSALLDALSIGMAGKANLFPIDSLNFLLQSPMLAVNNAPFQSRQFPLLLWSARPGTVLYQSILSEYLASWGYVVAFVEKLPEPLPLPWFIQSAEEKKKVMAQHIEVLNEGLEKLKTIAVTDPEKVGLLSWSYGGESALLLQSQNKEVDVVIGLSSISFSFGLHWGSQLRAQFNLSDISVPYLLLSEKIAPNGNERSIPPVLDSLTVASYYCSFPELAHGSFNTIEGMLPGIINTDKVHSWSKGGEVAKVGYEIIGQIVLDFLDAQFKEKTSATIDQVQYLEKFPPNFIKISQHRMLE